VAFIAGKDGEESLVRGRKPKHGVRMKITVILCTYNRCASLAKALASAAASSLSDAEWEVLVVDNNSKDQTREVVEDYCRKYPGRFRYLFESKQGKSHALNAGIRASRADVLAFMDDDVVVEPKWLQNLTEPLRSDAWDGTGGRILPDPAFCPPDWLATDGPYSLTGMLALFDIGDQECELKSPPFGTNMAFPRRIFERFGGFRTDLGPCPGSEIRNEDTEFGRRLLTGGCRLRYQPSAVVYHDVIMERLTKEYFLKFWYDQGRAMVREWGEGAAICGIPRVYLRMLKLGLVELQAVLRWASGLNRQARFFWKGTAWMHAGQIIESYRRACRSADSSGALTPCSPVAESK
jgi:glycosyltransferase involved in cell wall biosynthesis